MAHDARLFERRSAVYSELLIDSTRNVFAMADWRIPGEKEVPPGTIKPTRDDEFAALLGQVQSGS